MTLLTDEEERALRARDAFFKPRKGGSYPRERWDIRRILEAYAALKAENEKLREALDTIANKPIGHPEATESEVLDGIVVIARVALVPREGQADGAAADAKEGVG